MKKNLCALLATAMMITSLAGCIAPPADIVLSGGATATTGTANTDVTDLTSLTITAPTADAVTLKMSLAYGNTSRTMTYNQQNPLTLSDGTVITSGQLKPTWQFTAGRLNINFIDIAEQSAAATDMITTASTTGFTEAQIYGGNSIADLLVDYGSQGYFVALDEMMDQGYLPNFQAYLEENSTIRSSITAYDGHIYYVPYVSEIGSAAREWIARDEWPVMLLDGGYTLDTHVEITSYYKGFYVGDNARTGSNGGAVTPMVGVTITKATDENIIEIQNALNVKNGETLTAALIDYIDRNYDYESPSQLFVGAYAAYDIDELVALFRCIKANPTLLSDGKADAVWPLFTRQSNYREDLLRMSTYFGGVRAHGSDSYENRFAFDENGDLYYTYAEEGIYDVLTYLSAMSAEGLIYTDVYDTTNTANYRSILWGTDNATENAMFGFMTFDWIASSTAESLNDGTSVFLPPVANVNGVWQYYVDNTRVVKPDGWSISAASTQEQILKACELFDYYFTEEGSLVHNYGLPMNIADMEGYEGPDGDTYPLFDDWMTETCNATNNGDLSAFLRDWMGSQMAMGYQKEIGFEYQNTAEKGFESWALINSSTTSYPNYNGEGLAGDSDYYYYLTPTSISLTTRQQETVSTNTKIDSEDTAEFMFNIVRYHATGNAPSGASMAYTYEEYLKFFTDAGLDLYIGTYKFAYEVMQAAAAQ